MTDMTAITGLEGAPARYWRRLADGRLECELCPRLCKLQDGQRGLCFVRGRSGDEMILTTYGRSSGFCIDPIEKKPLNHFLPGTPVLSFGTAGCNLTCKFCQNWDISKSRQMDSLMDQAAPEVIARAAAQSGCRSVAYTYNDPVIFLEYAVDTAAACREAGIKNVAVSAGYICAEPRVEFYGAMDAVNIDLKAFTQDFYKQLCSSELDAVLETLKYIRHETDVWLEITTLLIPGENDSEAELEALTQWVIENLGPDVPLHFSAFHADYKMLNTPSTPLDTLLRAWRIARKNGVRHVYTGNVHHKETASTYCHSCGLRLIGRDWYELSDWTLREYGACSRCGAFCAGVFDAAPGQWGAKRQPVRIHEFSN
jgi:pyruvate formate lyase activating enzyme